MFRRFEREGLIWWVAAKYDANLIDDQNFDAFGFLMTLGNPLTDYGDALATLGLFLKIIKLICVSYYHSRGSILYLTTTRANGF